KDAIREGRVKELHVDVKLYYRDEDGLVYELTRYASYGESGREVMGMQARPRDQVKLRSEPLDAQRLVSSEDVFRAIRDGWNIAGTTSDGRVIVSKQGALRVSDVQAQPKLEKPVSPAESSPPGTLHNRQVALRDGALGLEFKQLGGN